MMWLTWPTDGQAHDRQPQALRGDLQRPLVSRGVITREASARRRR